ncbi:MAG: intron-encoded endonuclease I-SceI [Candidatus Parcubacteria bacterium]
MVNTVERLNQMQRSLIIGSILGDGYVRIIKGRKNAFLEINHSFKMKEYVDWKYEILKNIVISPPKMRKGNGNRIAYRFFTRQHPEITELFNLFYVNGKKVIPHIDLDEISLVVWYMDDGSKCGSSNYYLNTQQFTLEDQNKLLKFLKDKNIEARLNKDKIYWRIRILMSSVPNFMNLVSNHIISSVQYKI